MSNSSIILLYILIPYFLKVNAAEMRLNNQEQLVGSRCLLVPYCEKHVPKYHDWMSDPELLKATASEPLTLEQEFEMQKTWREDPDKLTFIVLDKRTWEATGDEIASMAGDINAFACPNFGSTSRCFEISVMVAEPNFRRRGIAREACQLLILYVGQRIGQSDFVAKIEANNQPSIALFRKKLNFKWDSFSQTFQLITLKLTAENIGDAVEEMDLRIQSYCE